MLRDDNWIEIDNTLEVVAFVDGSERYATRNGLFDASFARTPSDQLVTMERNGYTISWGLQVIGNLPLPSNFAVQGSMQRFALDETARAEVQDIDYSFLEADELKTVAKNSTSKLSYEKAFGNDIDINYFVLPTRIKEEIILNAPQDITAYIMTVSTDLEARLLDNRQIEFYHGDDVIFTMWAPYMYDNAGELSEEITVELVRSKNGAYTITMTPDAGWLNDPERVYPIVIDPDVTVNLARTNGLDNFVWAGQPTVVQDYNRDRTYIGRYRLNSSSPRYTSRTYQKYNVMPTIPGGSTITAATQTFKITSGTSTGAYASAYRVTGADWSSQTITWNNKPTATTSIAISGNNITQNGNLSELKLNMLSSVQAWYSGNTNGKNKNYGVMLRYQTETINDFNAFYSADVATQASRPKLVITYSSPGPTPGIRHGRSYMLKNNSGYFMDIRNHQTTVGTAIRQYTYVGDSNKRFVLQYRSDGEYTIGIGGATNRFVAVNAAGNVVIASSWTAATSRWYIVPFGSDYRFVNKSDTTKYLGAGSGIGNLSLTSSTNYATWSIADYSGFTTNGGLPNRTVTLQRIGTTTSNTTWLPLIQAAVNSWNNSGSGVNISTTTGASNHTIRVDNFPYLMDGVCIKSPSGNLVATSSKIEINTSQNLRASNNPTYNPPGNPNRLPQFRQAVIAHEIGHLFWLGDNPGPPSGTRSLMEGNHVRASSNWIFTPQTYDRNNVRWLYDQAHHH